MQLGANPDNDWINAAFYAGLMAAYRTTGTAALLTAARSWGTAHQWDLHGGATARLRHGDDQACTQTYDEIFLIDPVTTNNFMIAKGQAAFDGMIAAPQAGRVDWWWCDALFMAPPALARLGAATKQNKYFDFLDTMWFDSKAFLFDPAQNLFWRDSTFKNTDTYWARGNGWVVAGIPRVLDYLPMNDAKRADFITVFKALIGAVAKVQGADGLWRSNLLHANAFPNPETSGTGFSRLVWRGASPTACSIALNIFPQCRRRGMVSWGRSTPTDDLATCKTSALRRLQQPPTRHTLTVWALFCWPASRSSSCNRCVTHGHQELVG